MKLGFFTTLFLVLLILKLTGFIAWSWFWVTAPLWVGGLAVLWLAYLFEVDAASEKKRKTELLNALLSRYEESQKSARSRYWNGK
jgi:fatty acid desaturase